MHSPTGVLGGQSEEVRDEENAEEARGVEVLLDDELEDVRVAPPRHVAEPEHLPRKPGGASRVLAPPCPAEMTGGKGRMEGMEGKDGE